MLAIKLGGEREQPEHAPAEAVREPWKYAQVHENPLLPTKRVRAAKGRLVPGHLARIVDVIGNAVISA